MPLNSFRSLLKIDIVQASNLKDTDGIGKGDPYAVVSFDEHEAAPHKQQTHVINDTLSPVWNSSLYFLCTDEFKSFKVEIFDEDVGRDDKIGHVNILRREADVRHTRQGDVFYLENGKGGTVEVYVTEVDISNGIVPVVERRASHINEYLNAKNRDNMCLLGIFLHGAKGLKSGLIDKSDPYAKVDFSHDGNADHCHPKTLKTKTLENNPSPAWNEAFHFIVPWDLATFKVEIFDEDVGGDDSLGHVNVVVKKVGELKKNDRQAISKKGELELSYFRVPIGPLFG
jgi:Ca2+-dependent lipid-binding protein